MIWLQSEGTKEHPILQTLSDRKSHKVRRKMLDPQMPDLQIAEWALQIHTEPEAVRLAITRLGYQADHGVHIRPEKK